MKHPPQQINGGVDSHMMTGVKQLKIEQYKKKYFVEVKQNFM